MGGVELTGSPDHPAYAKTDADGKVTVCGNTDPEVSIVWDGTTLNLNGATSQNPNGHGIQRDGSLTIQLEGDNTVSCKGFSYGISTTDRLTIQGSGTLQVTCGNNYGIYADSVTVKGGTVNATGGIATDDYGDSYGIYADSVTVEGGALTATGGTTTGNISYSYGINGDVTVNDGALTATGGTAGVNSSCGIGSDSVTVNGGTLTATGGKATGEFGWSYGVRAFNNVTITGGEVTVASNDQGIQANTITIAPKHNTSIVVEVGDNADDAKAIGGSPFTEEETINISSAHHYFHSAAYAAVTITTQPSGTTVTEGQTATFTIAATGSEPLSYQWQQNMNGSGWTDITGETNATYTTGKTTMDMNGTQYRCVVSNSAGSVISDAATLAVQKSTTPIDPKYVRYIVEHYKQNADGRYTLADTEQPIDEIGKTVTATPKTYEGYTYNPNAAGTVASGTLTAIRDAADIVTLKLYYDLTVYTVTVEIEGSGTASASPASATAGTEIRLTADSGGNYHFERWEVVSGNITIENNAFSMPAENVTVRAVFAPDASGGSSGTEGGHTGDDEADEEDSDSLSGNIGVQEEADSPFTDVLPGDWFYNDVMFVWKNGLMDGTGAVTFSPDAPITRAQVALIFFRLAGSPEVTGDNPFTDVENSPATAWYYDAALWAHQRGIVAGYADHTWHPGDPVSREQLAVMFRNYANYRGYDLTAADDLSGYVDAGEVSEWAKESVRWAADRGMMNGRNSAVLNPTGIVTRAQAAAMLCRFIESNSLVPPVVVSGENEDAEGMDSGERGWTQQFPGPMTGSMARNDYVPVVSDGADTERRALRASKKQAKI